MAPTDERTVALAAIAEARRELGIGQAVAPRFLRTSVWGWVRSDEPGIVNLRTGMPPGLLRWVCRHEVAHLAQYATGRVRDEPSMEAEADRYADGDLEARTALSVGVHRVIGEAALRAVAAHKQEKASMNTSSRYGSIIAARSFVGDRDSGGVPRPGTPEYRAALAEWERENPRPQRRRGATPSATPAVRAALRAKAREWDARNPIAIRGAAFARSEWVQAQLDKRRKYLRSCAVALGLAADAALRLADEEIEAFVRGMTVPA